MFPLWLRVDHVTIPAFVEQRSWTMCESSQWHHAGEDKSQTLPVCLAELVCRGMFLQTSSQVSSFTLLASSFGDMCSAVSFNTVENVWCSSFGKVTTNVLATASIKRVARMTSLTSRNFISVALKLASCQGSFSRPWIQCQAPLQAER